jgi:hypothetical protein
MNELVPDEDDLRNRRRRGFDAFLADRMPVLADFAERLGLPDPPMIVAEPNRFLRSVSDFMKDQVIGDDDRVWALLRIGYFIGEILVQRLGCHWFLNEVPGSRYFLRYVVGASPSCNPAAMVDPFAVADAYLSQPPGRDLSKWVDSISQEFRSA